MSNTQHYFVPSVRHGLAATLGDDATGPRAILDVELDVFARQKGASSDDPAVGPTIQRVQLHGPGDVLGFDRRIVRRTVPVADVGNFEPNYFPHIEFADPDFVWRYTASNNHDAGSLIPWIALVVLVAESTGKADVEFDEERRTAPALPGRISVRDARSLPDLEHAASWAHVHITGSSERSGDGDAIRRILEEQPERAVSRLVCTRRLKPNVKYAALVVPTFKLGAFAGLGGKLPEGAKATDRAWTKDSGPVSLPYYYRWDFRTGQRGDFEHLVRLLEPRKLADLGLRKVDCAKPGFGLSGVTRTQPDSGESELNASEVKVLGAEGGLQSLDTSYTRWGRDLGVLVKDAGDIYDATVTRVGATAIEVAWRTVTPATSRVEYGPADVGDLGQHDEDPSLKLVHRLRVDGLTAKTKYQIRVVSESTGEISRTAPCEFDLPTEDSFQQELAGLLNRPNTEYREAREFSFDATDTDAIEDIAGTAIPIGDQVQITWRTAEPRSSRVEYHRHQKAEGASDEPKNENAKPEIVEDLVKKNAHALFLKKLIPGRRYRFTIIAKGETPEDVQRAEGRFDMPPLPAVLPPVYGRWHRGELKQDGALLDPNDQGEWLDAMNLDPRHRLAAGLGADIIRDKQEPLMASAWDQLGAVEKVNEVLRQGQLARDASAALHRKLLELDPDDFLRLTARVQKRSTTLEGGKAETVDGYLRKASRVERSALDAAFRRISGPRHGISKRQARAQGSALKRSIGKWLVTGEVEPAGDVRQLRGTPQVRAVTRRLLADLGVTDLTRVTGSLSVDETFSLGGIGDVYGNTLERLDEEQLAEEGERKQAADAITGWLQQERTPTKPGSLAAEFLVNFKSTFASALHPAQTVTARTRRLLRDQGRLEARFKEPGGLDPLDPVMWAPEFPQAMYEELRDKSQALLLPGLEKIPQNTLGLLKTNRRFVEAFMGGCNHTFAGELLWRGFPTDQRGTYFRQFWDVDEYVPRPGELNALAADWLDAKQVDSIAALPLAEKTQLLARDLGAAADLLVKELLAARGADSIADLNAKERAAVWALRKERIEAIDKLPPEVVGKVVEHFIKDEALRERLSDIDPMTRWRDGSLGSNRSGPVERLVLVIRGDLLKRYPGAVIYAIDAVPKHCTSGDSVPGMREYLACDNAERDRVLADIKRIFPVFRATLPPDLTLLGFPFDREAACGCEGAPGKYFMIEERMSEPRFGLDTPVEPAPDIDKWPEDLSWAHFGFKPDEDPDGATYLDDSMVFAEALDSQVELRDEWMGASAAKRAQLTLQKPVRIAVHASRMIPEQGGES